MQMLIDLILNKEILYNEKEYQYKNSFNLNHIHNLLSEIDVPKEIFIVNGPFYISGYRKALMFAEAINILYPVSIYGFDLLRDYSTKTNDYITINNRTFSKKSNFFSIEKEFFPSETDYSMKNLFLSLDILKLDHSNLIVIK